MRTALALFIFGLAIWRAALDWMGTVAQGGAWRFVSFGELWGSYFPSGPGNFETLITGYLGPEVWVYVSFILVMPMVALLCFLGGFVWMIRRPGHVERRSIFRR